MNYSCWYYICPNRDWFRFCESVDGDIDLISLDTLERKECKYTIKNEVCKLLKVLKLLKLKVYDHCTFRIYFPLRFRKSHFTFRVHVRPWFSCPGSFSPRYNLDLLFLLRFPLKFRLDDEDFSFDGYLYVKMFLSVGGSHFSIG